MSRNHAPAPAVDANGSAPSSAALAMIDQLIAFPTVSRDSNLGLIEFARDFLAAQGIKARLIFDRAQHKANLFATLNPGTQAHGGLILSGHTDTVPVDGQHWTSDPFVARHTSEGRGRIYGRGSADMKGFIALALAAAPQIAQARSARPIHLALTFDEETSFLGVRELIADLSDQGCRPAACLIGEPTNMQAIVAHKGKRDWRCCVRGRAAHSSRPDRGVNAIEVAARLITHIRATAERLQGVERADPRFDVPYTTLQTGVIEGGTAVNVIAPECRFEFELRNLPTSAQDAISQEIIDYAQQLLPAMHARAPEAAIEFELLMSLPPFSIDEQAPLVRWAQALAGTAHLGCAAVGFGTEASFYSSAGIPTVVLGPGSIEQAHQVDEYLSYEQVLACEHFFARLVTQPFAGEP